jgi:hypothetical protein
MIKTEAVRREIEHIRRSTGEGDLSALRGENLINWLRSGYYKSERGESQLEMFVTKYPWNANQIKSYILRDSSKLRLTTKQL